MQQQIEFEAIPFQHTVRIPDYIPDGVSVRVILSFDDVVTNKKLHQNRKTQQILQRAWVVLKSPAQLKVLMTILLKCVVNGMSVKMVFDTNEYPHLLFKSTIT